MTQAIGHGASFEIYQGSGYVNIAGSMSADFGSNKVDALDNTDFGTAGTNRTFVGGLENPGDLSVKLNVIVGDSSQALLFATKDSTVHQFKVLYPASGRTVTVSGIITSIDESIPDDKLPTYTVKIQLSGPKVYA